MKFVGARIVVAIIAYVATFASMTTEHCQSLSEKKKSICHIT
jgi:hypothetical protein